MTSKQRRMVGWSVMVFLPLAYLIGSEVFYARSISPEGVRDVAGYFQRFGEPRSVRLVERDGQTHYEFSGRLPARLTLAMPSAPPAYVFDAQGRFVEWCPDPGDTPSYRSRYPLGVTGKVDAPEVRRRFGIRPE